MKCKRQAIHTLALRLLFLSELPCPAWRYPVLICADFGVQQATKATGFLAIQNSFHVIPYGVNLCTRLIVGCFRYPLAGRASFHIGDTVRDIHRGYPAMLRQDAGRFFRDPRTRRVRYGKSKRHLRSIHGGDGRTYSPQIIR
jgi:hypothetical protein